MGRGGPGPTPTDSPVSAYSRPVTPIPLKRLDPDLPPPRRMRAGDAAADLPARNDMVVDPGQRVLMPTGFAVAIPEGWCGLILPRSGLALKEGLTVLNTPGLIDSGYRGELCVVLHNAGHTPVSVARGQRIAQFLVLPVPESRFEMVDELPAPPDDRGQQGFGSSG